MTVNTTDNLKYIIDSGDTSGSESDPLPVFIRPSWVGRGSCRLLLWSICSQAVSVCVQHWQQNHSASCWITWPAHLLLLLLMQTVFVHKTLFSFLTLGESSWRNSVHTILNREFKQSAPDTEAHWPPPIKMQLLILTWNPQIKLFFSYQCRALMWRWQSELV